MTRAGARENSIDSLIDAYRASPEFEDRKPATQRDYRRWLDRISERFGPAPLSAFADRRMRGEIILWRDKWKKQPRTADKASTIMAILLGWAVERGMLAVNHAAGIKQIYTSDRSELVWEPRHWQAVDAIEDFPPHIMTALRLASLTGLRLADLVGLEWSQVGDKAIIVEKTRKRGGRAVIPIFDDLRAFLDTLERADGAVLLNSRGKGWTASGLETVWQRRKPDGFDRRIHDLRGTFVTYLAVKGLTDEQIARIVGWTAQKVASIRARYVDEARVVISLVDRLSA